MWFGVSLLYRSSEPLNAQGMPLFEERIILLDAVDETNAWQRALQLGPSLDERYINAEGNQVVWTFERVLEVKMILAPSLTLNAGACRLELNVH